MSYMPGATALATILALALPFGGAAMAQGVAPGGGIANSTGIGSGLGPMGPGPSYPNGTTVPALSQPPPPGGAPLSSPVPMQRAPVLSTVRPSTYPQPGEPFETAPHAPATVPLSLPDTPPADLALLKGCWRTDVFQEGGHPGTTTYCFDDKGVGRFLFTRQDQVTYFCRGPAQAAYAGGALRLHGTKTTCSDGTDQALDDLDCHADGEAARCGAPTVSAESAKLHLYRVR